MRESQLLTNENLMESLDAGIEYAKNAVELDPNDGESWAILGNAYLSLFFRKQEDKLLRESINSFEKAVSQHITLTYLYKYFIFFILNLAKRSYSCQKF